MQWMKLISYQILKALYRLIPLPLSIYKRNSARLLYIIIIIIKKERMSFFYVHVLSWEKMAALGPWGPGAITNSASQWCNMLNNSLIN